MWNMNAKLLMTIGFEMIRKQIKLTGNTRFHFLIYFLSLNSSPFECFYLHFNLFMNLKAINKTMGRTVYLYVKSCLMCVWGAIFRGLFRISEKEQHQQQKRQQHFPITTCEFSITLQRLISFHFISEYWFLLIFVV